MSKTENTEERRGIIWPKVTYIALYSTVFCLISMVAFAAEPTRFSITLTDAEARISEELVSQGLGDHVAANIVGRSGNDLISNAEPVIMEIEDLKADEVAQRFTAKLAFSTDATVEKPAQALGRIEVSGKYDEMVDVPTLKFRVSATESIHAEDIIWKKMPSARLKHDTILEAEALIGKTPVRGLGADRPIKISEIKNTPIVARNSAVQMNYQTDHILIQGIGTALQEGAAGDRIRVRNNDSGAELEAMVMDVGKVRIMSTTAMN